jgi:hypothetical protein
LEGETENLPQSHFFHKYLELGSNPGRYGVKPETNRMGCRHGLEIVAYCKLLINLVGETEENNETFWSQDPFSCHASSRIRWECESCLPLYSYIISLTVSTIG